MIPMELAAFLFIVLCVLVDWAWSVVTRWSAQRRDVRRAVALLRERSQRQARCVRQAVALSVRGS